MLQLADEASPLISESFCTAVFETDGMGIGNDDSVEAGLLDSVG